jgi:hypothetical protein
MTHREPTPDDRPRFPDGHFPSWYEPPHGLRLTGKIKPFDSPLLKPIADRDPTIPQSSEEYRAVAMSKRVLQELMNEESQRI